MRAHQRNVHQIFLYRCAHMRNITTTSDNSVTLVTKQGEEQQIKGEPPPPQYGLDAAAAGDRSATDGDTSVADGSQSEDVELTPRGRVRRKAAAK